jgi:chromosome segregation protein
MTNEEVERAIDFLLKSHARFDARLEAYMEQSKERQERTDEQLAKTNAQLDRLAGRVDQLTDQLSSLADTQTEMMGVMMRTLETQSRINETQSRINESFRAAITELAERQGRTEASLAELTQKVDTLADAQINTNHKLDVLIKIVEKGRNGT